MKCDLTAAQEYRVAIGGTQFDARVIRQDENSIDVEIDNRRMRCDLYRNDCSWYVHNSAGDLEIRTRPMFSLEDTTQRAGSLSAPMPGKVLTLEVEIDTKVSSGQLLLVLEAMKMEHRIIAPYEGVISAVHVAIGDLVEKDVLLIEMAEHKLG